MDNVFFLLYLSLCMINLTDLPVGSFVMYGGHPYVILSFNETLVKLKEAFGPGQAVGAFYNEIHPYPISRGILLEMGFSEFTDMGCRFKAKDGTIFQFSQHENFCRMLVVQAPAEKPVLELRHITTVHAFQNLYRAVTGRDFEWHGK
jgi:hypothetical protein